MVVQVLANTMATRQHRLSINIYGNQCVESYIYQNNPDNSKYFVMH